jgi:phosphoribosylpyrophosphate synthetase
MKHKCDQECPCRQDLNQAATALANASKLFSESTAFRSDDLIENCYALVRAAKARVQGAREVYLEHRRELA